jgi:uncharacterized protein YndB with AHSA1/START domain
MRKAVANCAVCGVLSYLTSVTSVRADEAGSTTRCEVVVEAPVDRAWAAFTTKDGIESWMVPHAEIDLRVGGTMCTNYNAAGVIGDEGTIENTILCFEPQRMLSIKATKPPAGFAFKDQIESMWSVIYFEPLGLNRTRVRVVGMGYGADEASQKMREHFDKGNAWTLEKLRQRFARPDAAEQSGATLKLLRALVGGEWIAEKVRPDGRLLRARTIWDEGPGGKCVSARGWIGGEDGMFLHGSLQAWLEPVRGAVVFQNLDENGGIARGEIRMPTPNLLQWDWDILSATGETTSYQVDMTLEDPSHLRFIVKKPTKDRPAQELVNLLYTRVDEAPAVFKHVRASAASP